MTAVDAKRRLFVAVPVGGEALDAVTRIVERVRAALSREDPGVQAVRWVRLDGLHVTLRFLGPTPAVLIAALAAAVDEAAAGGRAFDVRLGGAGAFPGSARPRALWIGLAEGTPELAALARRLDDGLAARGWPREQRPFRAHLTLARSDGVRAGGATVRTLIAEAAGLDAGWTADRVVLFESHTGGGPARYEALHSARLAG